LAARSRYTVVGVSNTRPCEIPGVTVLPCDLRQPAAIADLFLKTSPDAVIHLAAVADPNFCETHKAEAAFINIAASVEIARHCSKRAIPCVFTSSDLVFDGNHPPYNETDAIAPVNIYGEQKATAEREMAAAWPQTIICRMPLMYGDAPAHAKSFIHPFIKALCSGNELKLFTDEYRTPVCAADAAAGLLLALEHAPPGILHLGGPQRLSRFDMGLLLAQALRISANITPCLQRDVPMTARRAADVSLDSAKAQALGFAPAPMAQTLERLECIRTNRASA
jgi:dTDP-4-dehydrorhamnose reductase